MGEPTVGRTVKLHHFGSELTQKSGDDCAAYRIDGIHHHLEPLLSHGGYIHERQCQHGIYMYLIERRTLDNLSDFIDSREKHIVRLGIRKHLLALLVAQELAGRIEKFQRIPLLRVVAGRDDYASVGLVMDNGHLRAGCCAESDIHHIGSAAEKGSFDQVGHHFAREPRIASNHYLGARNAAALANQTQVGRRELHHVERRKIVSRNASDSASDSGNRFYKCHYFDV